jgi:hypothetical protein
VHITTKVSNIFFGIMKLKREKAGMKKQPAKQEKQDTEFSNATNTLEAAQMLLAIQGKVSVQCDGHTSQ